MLRPVHKPLLSHVSEATVDGFFGAAHLNPAVCLQTHNMFNIYMLLSEHVAGASNQPLFTTCVPCVCQWLPVWQLRIALTGK